MHELFPDWVRTLYPDTSIESLPIDAWWSAIEEYVAEADDSRIIGLCRAAYRRASPEFDAEWRQALRAHDEKSPLRGADRQVSVLAGAALLHASGNTGHAPVALYLRRCATHVGWDPSLPDLELSDSGLWDAATSVRTVDPWPQSRRLTLQMRKVNEALANCDDPLTPENLRTVVEALSGSMNDLVSRSMSALVKVSSGREAPLLEQSDVLVWLLSGRCALAERQWSELTPALASVCAAFEVRGLSRFALGRPDARALISAAVDSASAKGNGNGKELASALEEMMAQTRIAVGELVPVSQGVIEQKLLELDPIELGARLHDELGLLEALRA